MKRKSLVFACLVLCLGALGLSPGPGEAPEVLVGLFSGVGVSVWSEGPWEVLFSDGGRQSFAPGRKVTFAAGEETLGAAGAALLTGGAHFSLEGGVSGQFPGKLLLLAGDGNLLVCNVVDAEDYVARVVSFEMRGDWPGEALKAQAVACRTYAAYKGALCSLNEDDLLSLRPENVKLFASDQVYRGLAAGPAALDACRVTRGEILCYGGAPAAAFFCADAGGMTEDVRMVWGGSVPYLGVVEEVPYKSPYSPWEISFDPERLGHLLGFEGQIESVFGGMPGASGRWSRVYVKTPGGLLDLKGNDFRTALGVNDLRSLLFSSYVTGGGEPSSGVLNPSGTVCVESGGRTDFLRIGDCFVLGEGLSKAGTRPLFVQSQLCVTGEKIVTFEGMGWGHGVGLSQYGAAAMADLGTSYREILHHYYPNTVLEAWW